MKGILPSKFWHFVITHPCLQHLWVSGGRSSRPENYVDVQNVNLFIAVTLTCTLCLMLKRFDLKTKLVLFFSPYRDSHFYLLLISDAANALFE